MNTTIESRTGAVTKRTTHRSVGTATPAVTSSDEVANGRPASAVTRLVFMVLLGAAACIALVGVVSQASSAGTSPDDPAPEVIVHLAD